MINTLNKGSAKLMKTMNRDLVIQTITAFGEISRSQLSKETHLALPSIMRIVQPLIERGLLIESRQGQSTGGRKPLMLKMNKAYKYIIGLEIAMTTTLVLSDFQGLVLEVWSGENLDFKSPQALLDQVLSEMRGWLLKRSIEASQVAGLGVGTPGHSFKHQGPVEGAILRGWEKIDVAAWFKDRIDLDVYTDNVCRTNTLSEIWFGMGRHYKDFLYIYLDQGVGCAHVSKGVIYKGAKGVAGEFGHHSIDYRGRQCYCGKLGCIEMYVSAGAVLKAYNGLGQAKICDLAALKSHKDQGRVEKVTEEVSRYLAYGLGNLINLYNPQLLVLGGDVVRVLPQLSQALEPKIKANIFSDNAADTPIYISQVQNESSNLGSIALVISEHIKAFDA